MKISHIGASRDGRTNQWSVTLSCGHPFTPPTTMFNIQNVRCPKCDKTAVINYNDQKITEEGY